MQLRTLAMLVLVATTLAQHSPKAAPEPKSVTVPFTLDHNRVIIDVDVTLNTGTTQRVRAWVDNGSAELYLSQRLATGMSCDAQICSGTPPVKMIVGGMTIPIGGRISGSGIKQAKVEGADNSPIAPGMNVEMNFPSTVLRNYDVLIDFPGHLLTIAQPGSFKFKGVKTKALVNAKGLIEIPSQIESKKYNLGLDLGSSISFLSQELFSKLAAAHPDWPHMTGAIGPANEWGDANEVTEKLMRVDRLQYGPLFLTNIATVKLQNAAPSPFKSQPDPSTAGALGSQALLNYRIGLDYAHSAVYFDIARMWNFPDFDVVGLILRAEFDGSFTIAGIADYDGKPSVPEVEAGDHLVAVDDNSLHGWTMGQVWALLGGEPGKQHALTIERNGKQFTVNTNVEHFLGATEEDEVAKPKSRTR